MFLDLQAGATGERPGRAERPGDSWWVSAAADWNVATLKAGFERNVGVAIFEDQLEESRKVSYCCLLLSLSCCAGRLSCVTVFAAVSVMAVAHARAGTQLCSTPQSACGRRGQPWDTALPAAPRPALQLGCALATRPRRASWKLLSAVCASSSWQEAEMARVSKDLFFWHHVLCGR